MTPYVCTHCGRHFEAEEKEILECPGCFWSTSVKKEEEWVEAKKEASVAQTGASEGPKLTFRIPARFMAGLLLVIGACVILFLGLPRLKSVFEKKSGNGITVPRPVEKMPSKSFLRKSKNHAPPSPLDPLTEEEKNILQRRLQVSADRPLDEEEKKIIGAQVSFKTGFSEKLPSQTWTLDGYKQMIAQQERTYKVSLPRSYKKKLEELFQAQYVPASEAFKNGEILKARDLWAASLAFPIYSNDIHRHRGVALTMLRPFIADTLSKIGAINSASIEKTVRTKEEEVSSAYAKLAELISKKSWQDSLAQTASIRKLLEAFADPEKLAGGQAPAYPASVNQVDQDIQATLFELLKVPTPAMADLEPIRRDIGLKEKLIETFISERLQSIQAKHDEALDAIRQGRWQEAETKLRAIDSPPSYFKDAQEKIRILKKLEDSGLDSPAQTG